ncbi:hypothetical protein CEXT_485671 [Caerostris extrusa]|uniref:Uncharacterized protein n=1 Tax=Caerostris extrusa TaxID=172846 RepID=A0AAV4VZF1_CAEEX|nr:hypothetical protein CEXT_485671 [Caerostris extrusa]
MQVRLSLTRLCFLFSCFREMEKQDIFRQTDAWEKGIAGNIRSSSLHLNVSGIEERKVEIPDQELSECYCIAAEIAPPSIKTSTNDLSRLI